MRFRSPTAFSSKYRLSTICLGQYSFLVLPLLWHKRYEIWDDVDKSVQKLLILWFRSHKPYLRSLTTTLDLFWRPMRLPMSAPVAQLSNRNSMMPTWPAPPIRQQRWGKSPTSQTNPISQISQTSPTNPISQASLISQRNVQQLTRLCNGSWILTRVNIKNLISILQLKCQMIFSLNHY